MTLFINALSDDQKAESVRELRSTFEVSPTALRLVPGSTFAYWVSDGVRAKFSEFAPFETDLRVARVGLQTSDNERFCRNWWEVLPPVRRPGWAPFVLGGSVTAFYYRLDLVVNWVGNGLEIRNFRDPGTGKQLSRPQNTSLYGEPGLTWGLRTRRFQPSIVPAGCIFSVSRYQAFVRAGYEAPTMVQALVALLNGSVVTWLLRMCSERFEHPKYVVGIVQTLPVPDVDSESSDRLAGLARRGWSARRSVDTVVEVSHAFVVPAVLQVESGSFGGRVGAWSARVAGVQDELAVVQSEIDELCFELYRISDEDRVAITEGFGAASGDDEADPGDENEDDDEPIAADPVGLAAGLVSWAVGVGVGRFDVRLATGAREWPAEPDPFDPLPVCSPAMLTGDDGLPLGESPVGYPVEVSPVLVDDPGHRLDIGVRVRSVFDVVFGSDADEWWTEVGDALGSKRGEVGAWLSKGFFDHHLKTHSKSRRKAPILWPIGTVSGSYVVWLYAHRVTADSLFQVLNDLVDPKLSVEQRRLVELTQEAGPNPSASQRKTIDAQEKLVGELQELRGELEAVAPLWAPDLNDGIVIVLAPLWRLFAHHRSWSKELKKHWDKLAVGDCDWSQLAMHVWPERVVPKCAEDRSLAIAHGLEDVFWVQDDDNDDKWHPRSHPTTPIDQLIADRYNPTITTALQQATQ